MQKVSLAQKLSLITDHWNPRIVGELNGQHVKLVKFQGEFLWHRHEHEDELFLVLKGLMRMDYRENGSERSINVGEGECIIVPHGLEHRPYAEQEVHVMLFEPAGTLNTGNIQSERTIAEPVRL